MANTREKITAYLKTYPDLKRKIALLKYERSHPVQVSEHEVISKLAFSHSVNREGGTSTHISNKTMQIALNFQDERERLNYATVMEIEQELCVLEMRIQKLDFYVSQLEEKQAEVIRKFYFEEKNWSTLQRELQVSSRTLMKRRNEALDALAAMEDYMVHVTKGTIEE